MSHRSELPPPDVDVTSLDEDPAMFDPAPEWFISGLRPSVRHDADAEGLGLRSLIDQPDLGSRAWRRNARLARRVVRSRLRVACRSQP